VPLSEPLARANSEAEWRIGEHAKRVRIGRRAFLQSLCGAATTFLTLNKAFAALGNTGGLFRVPEEGAFETAEAADVLPYGPKTDSEYDALIADRGGLPA